MKKFKEENADLRDQLSNALEHHTSKSVGSLGSEFSTTSTGPMHRKTPSVHSDSVSDHGKTIGSSSGVSSDLSDSENEQDKHSQDGKMDESGIFVEHAGSSNPDAAPKQHDQQQQAEIRALQDEIQKLHKLKLMLESSGDSPTLIRRPSDYDSCDELDELKEECRDLVDRKNSLENEIEEYKGEIK